MTDLTPGPSAPFSADRASVRIRFVGFWDGFDPRDNFFTRLLAPRWRLDFDGPPDFILYTTVGSRRKEFLEYDCTRIFFTGENVGPDWLNCDWAFTFRHDSHPLRGPVATGPRAGNTQVRSHRYRDPQSVRPSVAL